MQIDPTRLGRVPAPGLEKVAGAPAASRTDGAQPADTTGAADRLVLSPQAAEVRAAHEALAAMPETRAELVARLKAQVQAGTYQIDPDTIAEKMIP